MHKQIAELKAERSRLVPRSLHRLARGGYRSNVRTDHRRNERSIRAWPFWLARLHKAHLLRIAAAHPFATHLPPPPRRERVDRLVREPAARKLPARLCAAVAVAGIGSALSHARAQPKELWIVALDCSSSMLRGGALAAAKGVAHALQACAVRSGAHVALISFRGPSARTEVTSSPEKTPGRAPPKSATDVVVQREHARVQRRVTPHGQHTASSDGRAATSDRLTTDAGSHLGAALELLLPSRESHQSWGIDGHFVVRTTVRVSFRLWVLCTVDGRTLKPCSEASIISLSPGHALIEDMQP